MPCLSAVSVPCKVSPNSFDKFDNTCNNAVVNKSKTAVPAATSYLDIAINIPSVTPANDNGSVLRRIDFKQAFTFIFLFLLYTFYKFQR